MKSAFLQTKSLQTLDDVGGWENRRKMGIVTAALYDPNACGLILSNEEELLFFLDHLNACDLVLGYNLLDFDLELLRAYGTVTLPPDRCFDMMQDLYKITGVRLSLAQVSRGTLGLYDDGSFCCDLNEDFRLGRELMPATVSYNDVLAMAEIHEYGVHHGAIKYVDARDRIRHVPVQWRHC